MIGSPTAPQRSSLRFCKAFFEVHDLEATVAALESVGAEAFPDDASADPRVSGPEAERWFWWSRASASGEPFLLRLRGRRLILEGSSPDAVGRGWRELDRRVQPHARARVAAGDQLDRFLPRAPRHAGDRPETWSREHEARVLREFYAAFSQRWADRPHPRLGGLSPRQAAARPELRATLEEVLARLEQIEAERLDRGLASFAVDDLRSVLALEAPEVDG